MMNMAECLPYGLEVARQLHDAQKPLNLDTIVLQWDADFFVEPGMNIRAYLHMFEQMGALRAPRISQNVVSTFFGPFVLPRRRKRDCPYHQKVCLPTREDSLHWGLAIKDFLHGQASDVGKRPTFLVDLLDPWPRGISIPVACSQRRPLAPTLRYYILKRDGFRCQLCGISVQQSPEAQLVVDHKTPVASGGGDNPENLWCLCVLCNQGKGSQDAP